MQSFVEPLRKRLFKCLEIEETPRLQGMVCDFRDKNGSQCEI